MVAGPATLQASTLRHATHSNQKRRPSSAGHSAGDLQAERFYATVNPASARADAATRPQAATTVVVSGAPLVRRRNHRLDPSHPPIRRPLGAPRRLPPSPSAPCLRRHPPPKAPMRNLSGYGSGRLMTKSRRSTLPRIAAPRRIQKRNPVRSIKASEGSNRSALVSNSTSRPMT